MRVQDMHMCEHCHKVKAQMSICSRCRHAWYCSPACQRAAWKAHRKTCTDVMRVLKESALDDGRPPFMAGMYTRVIVRVRSGSLSCVCIH